MSPITNFLAGWMVSNLDHLSKKDRLLVTVAGAIPDAWMETWIFAVGNVFQKSRHGFCGCFATAFSV